MSRTRCDGSRRRQDRTRRRRWWAAASRATAHRHRARPRRRAAGGGAAGHTSCPPDRPATASGGRPQTGYGGQERCPPPLPLTEKVIGEASFHGHERPGPEDDVLRQVRLPFDEAAGQVAGGDDLMV